MRLRKIGLGCVVPLLVLLATVGCDHGGLSGESASSGPATVQLVPSSSPHTEGDTIVAEVVITQADGVGSVAFHLLYDKEVLRFLPPAVEGPFLREDGTITAFLAVDHGDGGELIFGLVRLGASTGADGAGLLATFKFEVIDEGSSQFEFVAARVMDPTAKDLPSLFIVSSPR